MKVREVGYEEKTAAEREEAVIKAHEEKKEEVENKTPEETPKTNESEDLDDNKVLDFIKKKSGKEISSFDDLFQEKVIEKEVELPEDVETYYKYKKETGRGLDDFIKLNRDLDNEDPTKLLKDFYKENNPELDSEDIEFMMEKFSYDDDIDSESDIKKAKLEMKKELAKAKDHYGKLKEQYKVPLESREPLVPQEELEDFNAYKEYKTTKSKEQEENAKRNEFFRDKTEELFSDKFEGFKFKLGEESEITYKPGEASKIKEQQSSLNNFIGKFLNDDGYLNDAEAFHRAISIASDPDKFAKFAYEQGQADMASKFEKEDKNIDMVRTGKPITPKSGPIVRESTGGQTDRVSFKKR